MGFEPVTFTLVLLGFISGSIPWAVIFTKYLSGKDVRSVGDGNPGATNSFIIAGWKIGTLTVLCESGKGAIPVLIADLIVQTSLAETAIVGAACILGHAYSPFLRLRGGKAVAVSSGVWTAITLGEAFPVACSLLAICYLVQKNDSWTVTLSMLIFGGFIVLRFPSAELYALWAMNLALFVTKHWAGLQEGIQLRWGERHSP